MNYNTFAELLNAVRGGSIELDDAYQALVDMYPADDDGETSAEALRECQARGIGPNYQGMYSVYNERAEAFEATDCPVNALYKLLQAAEADDDAEAEAVNRVDAIKLSATPPNKYGRRGLIATLYVDNLAYRANLVELAGEWGGLYGAADKLGAAFGVTVARAFETRADIEYNTVHAELESTGDGYALYGERLDVVGENFPRRVVDKTDAARILRELTGARRINWVDRAAYVGGEIVATLTRERII